MAAAQGRSQQLQKGLGMNYGATRVTFPLPTHQANPQQERNRGAEEQKAELQFSPKVQPNTKTHHSTEKLVTRLPSSSLCMITQRTGDPDSLPKKEEGSSRVSELFPRTAACLNAAAW